MNIIQRFLGSWLTPAPRAESTTLRSPATWFLDALFGSSETASGVRVSEAAALGLSAYYCGVNMIAGTIGTLPLNVYKREGRGREVWEKHPAHYLLHSEPNPEMTAASMRQTWMLHALGRGNAYGEIVWDARGNISEIWPIAPHLVKPKRADDGKLWYEVRPWDNELRYLKPEDVLHIPGLGYDGIMGYGLIQVARESIGLNVGQEQYAAKFFRNGGNVSATLQTDRVLDDKQFQRLKSEVASKLQGLTNAHRIAILENGLKLNPLNPNHRDAQLIEARRFTVEEWARWLNMPPHKLKEMTHATFSNIEHQNIEWVVDTIRPWLVRFEQEFNRKIFRKQSVFYMKHVVDGLLRGDQASRFAAYATARNWGWFSANDVLELEDRNPLPGKQGDMYLVPANMIPADQAGKQLAAPASVPAPPPEEDDEESEVEAIARRLARATAERLVRYEDRLLATSGAAAYIGVGEKIAAWAGVSAAVADEYCAQAQQLNLIAGERGISPDELALRKTELLTNYLLKGEMANG